MFDRARYYLRRLAGAAEPGGPIGPAGELDRRATVRYPADVSAVCRASEIPFQQSVRIRDVCRTGVSLLLDQPLSPGALLTLEVPGRSGRPATTLLAFVKHSTARPVSGWVVGCAFAAELDDDALRGFGVARAPAPDSDQRNWERQSPAGVTALARAASADGPASRAEVMDLSPAGAGLRFDARVEPGTLLHLEFYLAGTRPAVTILASVVYLSRHPASGWVAGCNFIRELSDEDLQRLW